MREDEYVWAFWSGFLCCFTIYSIAICVVKTLGGSV